MDSFDATLASLSDSHRDWFTGETVGKIAVQAVSFLSSVPTIRPSGLIHSPENHSPQIRGVEHLHSLGYVHRDLKTENICIRFDGGAGTVKIIDFGLAEEYLKGKCGGHKPQEMRFVGTPYWVPLSIHYSLSGECLFISLIL